MRADRGHEPQLRRPAAADPPHPSASDKSRTTAGVLALLLGGLGVHKFYLGKPIQGLLYLLFCWTLIPAFIAFIEAILLLTMLDEKFAATYD